MKQATNPSDAERRFREAQESRNKELRTRDKSTVQNVKPGVAREFVENALQAVEAAGIDITADYNTWRNIGFSLCDEFGEEGREFYHRISRFYPKYHSEDCDKQYTQCLKSGGSGITLASFFHYIKAGGVQIPKFSPRSWEADLQDPAFLSKETQTVQQKKQTDEEWERKMEEQLEAQWQQDEKQAAANKVVLPTFPETVYANLPDFLKRIINHAKDKKERDMLLLGSMGVLSSCLSKVYGVYHDLEVYPNLYLFITAAASSGKGRLNLCKQLIDPIHRKLRAEVQEEMEAYKQDVAIFNATKGNEGEKPAQPKERMLLLPANSSSSGIFQLLDHNDGRGLIFETEADTLNLILKTDYGNYSDGFRKAFHHEAISYFRKTDREYVNIENPRLSTVLSGTPGQVSGLIKDAENGLFSRFAFYHLEVAPIWENVFARNREESIKNEFSALGKEFQEFVTQLDKRPNRLKVEVTIEQERRFNAFFSVVLQKYLTVQKDGYVATVRRLGLVAYRFMMIFSALRSMNGSNLRTAVIRDEDFNAALEMVSVLVKHASFVYTNLPNQKKYILKTNKKEQLLELLPAEFNYKLFREKAMDLEIADRSGRRYLGEYIRSSFIVRKEHGVYSKVKR